MMPGVVAIPPWRLIAEHLNIGKGALITVVEQM
jgi:hypothetical protein